MPGFGSMIVIGWRCQSRQKSPDVKRSARAPYAYAIASASAPIADSVMELVPL